MTASQKPESADFMIEVCWSNEKVIRQALNSIQSIGQPHKLDAEVVIQYCLIFDDRIKKTGISKNYWVGTRFNISTNFRTPSHFFCDRTKAEYLARKVTYATVELGKDGWNLIHVSREGRGKFGHNSEVHPMYFPMVISEYYKRKGAA